jgi:hypothetical protein
LRGVSLIGSGRRRLSLWKHDRPGIEDPQEALMQLVESVPVRTYIPRSLTIENTTHGFIEARTVDAPASDMIFTPI